MDEMSCVQRHLTGVPHVQYEFEITHARALTRSGCYTSGLEFGDLYASNLHVESQENKKLCFRTASLGQTRIQYEAFRAKTKLFILLRLNMAAE